MIKKILVVGGLVTAGLFLGGCSLVAKPAKSEIKIESPVQIITGKIIVSGDVVSISSSGKVIEITSRKIDLKNYNGRDVTVWGEYSGTTLFVDRVE